MDHKENSNNTAEVILVHLLQYNRYLYEEEKRRTERLENKANVFAVALGGSFVAVFIKMPVEKIQGGFNGSSPEITFAIVMFTCAMILFLASSIFTFFVYRVQKFERLSNPKELAEKSQHMHEEAEILVALIADYTVATNKNHSINERKASHLSYALLSLLCALLFIILARILFEVT